MARISFGRVTDQTINRDIEPFQLPPGVWSDGLNILFKNKKAEKAFGWAAWDASPSISPRAIFYCPLGLSAFWVYLGLTAAYAFDINGTEADVSNAGGAFTMAEGDRWNFAYFHGLGIFNNGVDVPQSWVPSLANNLTDLSNWTASTTAKVIRSFRNYLIALHITNGSGSFPQLIRWSHAANPGALPSSWDIANATVDAGELPLSDTPGALIDCAPLGGSNIVYKEDAIYSMTFVGGRFIFAITRLPISVGLLAQDCVVQLPNQHFVVTRDDVILHNGVQAQSILDGNNRRWLANNFEQGGAVRAFAFYYRSRSEVWFCFPLTGSGVANMVLIYNVIDKSVTFRELPAAHSGVYTPAIRASSDDTWAGDTSTTWGGETSQVWDEAAFVDIKERIFFLDNVGGSINEIDTTVYSIKSISERSYVERRSMAWSGIDQQGRLILDLRAVKFVQEVWPGIVGTSGATVSVYVGTQMEFEEAITWLDPVDFVIGTTNVIPVYATCRFLSVRFEATSSVLWEVTGFEYDVELAGVF